MASKAFSNTLSNLASDKLKDRTQGLEDVRLFLSVQRNIDWMNEDRKQWIRFLQSIFQIVVDEQRAYVSKPTTPALKRLKDAAQAVRLIIEKAAADIPRKAFKAVFNHILSIIVVRGQLFEPVALEYLKALRASVLYQPHLDHLDLKQWTHAVSTCFSAILGDKIRGYEIVDDYLMDADDDNEEASARGSRKRKAASTSRASSTPTEGTGSSQSKIHASASQDTIELCGCIDAFFQSSQAPLIANGEALLSKCIRFFAAYPSETTAHLSMTTALNRLLAELEFNRKDLVEKAVIQLWSSLISLWPTKNVAMKEQLVITATLLLPYIASLEPQKRTTLASNLYTATLADVEARWGADVLDLNALSLNCSQSPKNSSSTHGFAISSFQAGPAFDFQQALAWTVIQVCASSLLQVENTSSNTMSDPSDPSTPSRATKRLKLEQSEDLYGDLLTDLSSPSPKIAIHRLQIFIFIHEFDCAIISNAIRKQLLTSTSKLLSHEEYSVQAWALVLLATLSRLPGPISSALSTRKGDETMFWLQIWERSLKAFHQAHISRAACYLLWILYSADVVDSSRMTSDLVKVATDIEVQGPPSPSDAASAFLQIVLQVAKSDFRAYKLDIAGKVCSRVISHWHWPLRISRNSRTFAQKVNIEPISPSSLFELFLALSSRSLPKTTLAWADVVIPDGALTTYWRKRQSLTPMRDWFWKATVSESTPTNDLMQVLATDSSGAGESRTDTVVVRLVAYLRRLIEQLIEELEEADELYWAVITLERLRSILDLIVLSIAFDGYADAAQIIRNERVCPQAIQLTHLVMPRLQQSKWTLPEKASLLAAISPLFLNFPRASEGYEVLVTAGLCSGIRATIPIQQQHHEHVPTAQTTLLRRIWAIPDVVKTFASYSNTFQQILNVDMAVSSRTSEDADFGPIRITTSTQMNGRAMLDPGTSMSTRTCLSAATRMLVTLAYFSETGEKPIRLRSLVKKLLEDTGARFILVGSHLLDALRSGHLVLSSNELEGIVDKIGMELLPSYEYSRTDDLHKFVLKFLIATVLQWGKEEAIEMPYVDKARKLAAWFTGQLLYHNIASWQIRNRCIDLLDQFVSPNSIDSLVFGHESETLACQDGVPVLPEAVLIEMLEDPDYRVRFKLAPVIGRACSHIHKQGRQSFAVWSSIAEKKTFDFQGASFESNITTLLTYSNIIISSDFFRSNAYHPITVLAALNASASTSRFVKAALTATAERLGLSDLAALYSFLAPFTLAEQLYNSQEGLLIPDPTAFGFPNKQAMYSARFDETAPMVLAGPRPQFFQDMCTYVGIEEKVALARVFPTYVAYKLTAGEPGSNIFKLAEQDIALKTVEVASQRGLQAPDMLRSMRDLVVWRLFSFIWEAEYSSKTIQSIFEKCWPSNSLARGAIASIFTDSTFRPNVLSPPDVRLEAILYSIRRSHPAIVGALDEVAILNSVLHRLLCAVAEPPFTSQQLRLLHNAAICLACAASTLGKSADLLAMVLHRLSALARQYNLLSLVSRMFMWTLNKLVSIRHDQGSELQEECQSILVAADAAVKLSDCEVEGTRSSALRFIRDLEDFQINLRKDEHGTMAESAIRLRVLWPRALVDGNDKPTLQQVERVLRCSRITSDVYNALCSLPEALIAHPTPEEYHRTAQFLWSILSRSEAASLSVNARPEVFRAFAQLLYVGCGRVSPPALDKSVQLEVRKTATHLSVKSSFLQEISMLLCDTDLPTVQLAFETLLNTLASSSEDMDAPVANARLDMIRSIHIRRHRVFSPALGAAMNLEDLLHNDHWLEVPRIPEKWRRDFAAFLAKILGDNIHFYQPSRDLLSKNGPLSRRCLPSLVLAILLEREGASARENLSKYFEALLDQHKPCTPDILGIVLELRACVPPDGFADIHSPTAYDLWLQVPYLKLARAAIEAHNYHAALLCVELSKEYSDPINVSALKSKDERELLYEIYSNLQEPDGFYSISASDLPGGLVRRLHHEGRWLEALSWHGAGLEAAPHVHEGDIATQRILDCLARGNLGHLAMKLLRADPPGEQDETLPTLAWKTQNWDIPVPQDTTSQSSYRVYNALKVATGIDQNTSDEHTLLQAISSEMIALTKIDGFSPAADERRLINVLALREVSQWREDPSTCLETFLSEPAGFSQAFTYEASEIILETRLVLLTSLQDVEARKKIDDEPTDLELRAKEAERATLLTLSSLARSRNRSQTALNAVLKCQRTARKVDHELALATASVLWLQNESVAAIETLRQFLLKHSQTVQKAHQAQILAQMGTWIATARLEDASAIREQYFEPAWHRICAQEPSLSAAIASEYARFADDQYQETTQQVAEIDQLDSYTRKKEIEVLQLVKQSKSSQGTSSDLNSRHRVASAISQQDRQTIEQFRASRKALLESAVIMYGHALSGADDDPDAVYRLCSLWLGNSNDEAFCATAHKAISRIPSYRFNNLVPQLSARLAVMQASGTSYFQQSLTKLVERLASEHPFHSLFQLYFLYNTSAGHASQSSSSKRRSLGPEAAAGPPVKDLLLRLRQVSPNMRQITQAVELAIEAYVDWASAKVEKHKPPADKVRPLPPSQRLLRLKDLPIPVTTLALPVDKTCIYDSTRMPCIVGYKDTYTTAGGVNLPKITDCVGSDGHTYRQLFKGGDDVRQDAVMQQIFGVTNDLLARDDGASTRKLGIRTYKVVPLTGDCGLLEFVANSQAIGDWLVPAHAKYRPIDMPIMEARKKLAERQKASDKERVEVYKNILKRVQPVMRHFFTEKHHVPYWWFQMRLNYSRSAAAMSMVGYVMGLGDRHVSNIMIDTVTGELVPIDFGIAFEAGKQLPTPEQVPFRLTPDIVDGFGISGVEGVFRKCSEETIRVLRSKSPVLMTILEVFKYDPLQKWTASASKLRRIQGSQALDRNEDNSRTAELTDADRAIRTVWEKLKSDLSVEYNVNDLILQARDVAKLGSIFFGWQPYL